MIGGGGVLTAIKNKVKQIDEAAVDGLEGVYNSLAYRVHEVERHFHGQEKWLGLAVAPSGETHRADVAGPGVLPFSFLSGNNNWGAWVQIVGSDDTPIKPGMLYWDAHSAEVTDANGTNPFFVQVAAGESADLAARVAAMEYTVIPFTAATNQIDSGRFTIMSNRLPTGTKVWARSLCVGANAKTVKAYFGIHEYEG